MHGLNRQLGASLHHQITTVLKDGIITGRYPAGESLPSEDALCGLFSVSRITVRRAVQSLVEQGLVERRQGRGSFVMRLPNEPIRASFSSFAKRVADISATTRAVVEEFSWVSAPLRVREALELDAVANVLRIVRIRKNGKQPIMQISTYLPEPVGRKFSRDDFANPSMSALIADAGHVRHRVECTYGAVLADPVAAVRLQVSVGTALLDIHRRSFDRKGRPFEYVEAIAPPDRYQAYLVMTHPTGEDPHF
ncbi:GntR family transcriptional regulator [Tardiphaga sp. 215_C5_N2_1]|uniref:GntR family transcriptional regulator n=1 Tax=Tardiphaga sp. 215_C5_N2_1 TaxID=3240774 RepID=UPI003F8A7D4A